MTARNLRAYGANENHPALAASRLTRRFVTRGAALRTTATRGRMLWRNALSENGRAALFARSAAMSARSQARSRPLDSALRYGLAFRFARADCRRALAAWWRSARTIPRRAGRAALSAACFKRKASRLFMVGECQAAPRSMQQSCHERCGRLAARSGVGIAAEPRRRRRGKAIDIGLKPTRAS